MGCWSLGRRTASTWGTSLLLGCSTGWRCPQNMTLPHHGTAYTNRVWSHLHHATTNAFRYLIRTTGKDATHHGSVGHGNNHKTELTADTLLTTSLATARPCAKVRAATNARVTCSLSFRGTSPKGFSCSVYLLTHSRYSSVKWYWGLTSRNMRSSKRAQNSLSISSRLTLPPT